MNSEPVLTPAPRRILVVEDHPANARLARCVIESEGHCVSVAAEAASALCDITKSRPDLVVMDIGLPGASGLELTRSLKQGVRTRDIPVLVVSAFATKADADAASFAGADAYLSKPLEIREFVAVVEKLLLEHPPSKQPERP